MRIGVLISTVTALSLALLPRAPAAPSQETNLVTTTAIDSILKQLADPRRTVRDTARAALRRTDGKIAPTDRITLLRAAGKSFPREAGEDDTAQAIIAYCEADPALVAVAKEIYPAVSLENKADVLFLLLRIPDRTASVAYMDLLKQSIEQNSVPRLNVAPILRAPRDADIFFPRLLNDAPHVKQPGIYSAALAYCEQGKLADALIVPAVDSLLTRYQALQAELTPAQKPTGIAWRWEDKYLELRSEAEVLLDLLGYLPAGQPTNALLRQATTLEDARLKAFAALSLLRREQDVPADVITAIASSDEMRRTLFVGLQKLKKEAQFPTRFLTKEAMARSDMVEWLVYPTELAREPDEIELMKIVPDDNKKEPADLYIFRFRTLGDHWAVKNGWLEGEAGPYPRSAPAGCSGMGSTFSEFKKWDEWERKSKEQTTSHALKSVKKH